MTSRKTEKASAQIDCLTTLHKIPGLGPKRCDALYAAGIKNLGDLLHYYPARYIDRRECVAICEIGAHVDRVVTVRGTVASARRDFFGKPRYRVMISDGGANLEAVWYVRFLNLKAGEKVMLTGKVFNKGKLFFMFHPVMEKITEKNENTYQKILAVYPVKEEMRGVNLTQAILRKSMAWALKNVTEYPQELPAKILEKYKFPPLDACLQNIHLPSDLSTIDTYKKRLKYEELYKLALDLRWNRKKFALPGFAMTCEKLYEKMLETLPFELTETQTRAIKILHEDSAKPFRMHRLLQGDVGSGKTVTALFAALPALESGRQVAWMAPTEILAKQTKNVAEKYLNALGINVGYLGAGNTPEKKETLQKLALGELKFVVGTHALFMPSVRFKNLGMVLIDEQHKFGAAQRLALQERGASCDFLMMSATPIPQTLVKTLYGDLDVVDIAPRPNRAVISTHIVPENKRADMENFICEQIDKGGRVFYVVPRIELADDEADEDMSGGKARVSTVDAVAKRFRKGALSRVPIHKLHGRMSYDEREEAMTAFRDGPCGMLIATSIVEVGVDVCDATVMVIENPEYFGLAQLHQMRGRVGRGSAPAYCFLLPGENAFANEKTIERLKFLCECADGYKIAEWDLRSRGPGETAGYKQSGWDDLRIADILEDSEMFEDILRDVSAIFR